MNILEELWYGNLDPAEYDTCPDEEYKELVCLISRNEEKLLATMTDAQKDLFSRYQDCVREYQAMTEYLLFQISFCLGAQIMLKVLEKRRLKVLHDYLDRSAICKKSAASCHRGNSLLLFF